MRSLHVHFTSRATRCSGFTLVELVVVVAIISILSAIVFPPLASLVDRIDLSGAANDAQAIFATARQTAIARSAIVTVDIDTVTHTLVARIGRDTVRVRNEKAIHAVRLQTTRSSMSYSPTGMGYGTANLTLIITKHALADTIIVSRLGRVRVQ